MTVSRDLVNHKKWSWYKIDTRNGKSVMKLVKFPILRPLTFWYEILGQFDSLKILNDLLAGWQSLPSNNVFPHKSS